VIKKKNKDDGVFNPEERRAETIKYKLIKMVLDNSAETYFYDCDVSFRCDKYRNYFCDIIDEQQNTTTIKVTARTSENNFIGNYAIRVEPKLQKVYAVEVFCER
jgi:hypothetical protein